MRIGFIGTGEIAESMVKGIAGKSFDIWVSKRNALRSSALTAELSDVSVHDNQEILNKCDVVSLCLMANVASAELEHLDFQPNTQIISVMVDVSLEQLQKLCYPATSISITIPLPFIATGGCPLPVFPDTGAVRKIFGDDNIILPIDTEKGLNAHFAASAMASASFGQMKTARDWLGAMTDDTVSAEAYILAMLGGFISAAPLDGQQRIEQALDALSTEGGLNASLRAYLETSGAFDAVTTGLDSFKPRLGL